MTRRMLVVGAGFSGAVFARAFCELSDQKILIIDERSTIAGNCYTKRDPETEVMTHVYGPHIFNTSNERVWDYVQRFSTMMPFTNRVKASTSRGIFGLPINLHTINQFFGARMNPSEAAEFIRKKGDQTIAKPRNFEEQALRFLGKELYETFFRGYTIKQWGCDPTELPADILKRLPVRFNYNDNYYGTRFQGIPKDGYTDLISRILDHENIEVRLNTPWDPAMRGEFAHVVFTGCLDKFYNLEFGPLSYRTVFWEKQTGPGDLQGNAVINYTELTQPFTRVHEHKHFAPWEDHARSVLFTEYSKETTGADTPYYPKRLPSDLALLARYQQLATQDEMVSFLGRLSTYRYMDMEKVIGEALEFAEAFLKAAQEGRKAPIFPAGG